MTLYGKFLAIAVAALSLAGCSVNDSGKITDYRDADAKFTLTFPSAYGDVLCDGEKKGGCTTITIREPTRSAGVTVKVDVKVDAGSCAILVNDCEIPLTPDAADGLTDIIDTLYKPLNEPVEAARTSDGTNTAVTTPYGVLYLDGNMLPCAVECETWNGETRTIAVSNYIIEVNNTSTEIE